MNWSPTNLTQFTYNGVSFANDLEGWAVGDFGVIAGTHDGGATWFVVQPGGDRTESAERLAPIRRPGIRGRGRRRGAAHHRRTRLGEVGNPQHQREPALWRPLPHRSDRLRRRLQRHRRHPAHGERRGELDGADRADRLPAPRHLLRRHRSRLGRRRQRDDPCTPRPAASLSITSPRLRGVATSARRSTARRFHWPAPPRGNRAWTRHASS